MHWVPKTQSINLELFKNWPITNRGNKETSWAKPRMMKVELLLITSYRWWFYRTMRKAIEIAVIFSIFKKIDFPKTKFTTSQILKAAKILSKKSKATGWDLVDKRYFQLCCHHKK